MANPTKLIGRLLQTRLIPMLDVKEMKDIDGIIFENNLVRKLLFVQMDLKRERLNTPWTLWLPV